MDQLFVGGTGDVYANYNNGKLPATVNVTLTGTLDIDQCGHKESKPFTLTGTANKDCQAGCGTLNSFDIERDTSISCSTIDMDISNTNLSFETSDSSIEIITDSACGKY